MAVLDQAQHYRLIGGTLLGRGLLMAAREAFQGWLDVAEREGTPQRLIRPLNALATVDLQRKEFAAALTWLERARLIADTHAVSAREHLIIHANLMLCRAEQNVMDLAKQDALAMEALLAQLDEPELTAHSWANLSYFYCRTREWNKAVEAAQAGLRCYRMLEARGIEGGVPGLCHVNLGVAQAALGDDAAAALSLERAIDQFMAQGAISTTAYAHCELGWIYYRQDDYTQALQAGQAALERLLRHVKAADKEEVARVSWLFGSIFAAWGERNTALKFLNRAATYFAQTNSRVEWEEVFHAIGELLGRASQSGAGSQARPYLKQLDRLARVLDLVDDLESVAPHLRGHAERVAAIALLIGQAVGLTDDNLSDLHHAAFLHDSGQIAIDAEVLCKPEWALQASERELLRRHPELGDQMLRPFGFPLTVAEAVRYHHENYDGTGYPKGLSKKEIPILSRIIAIAEMYDESLTLPSPPLTHEQALQAVLDKAGKELDPALCECFADLFVVEASFTPSREELS